MEATVIAIVSFVSAHLVGVLLLVVNGYYLTRTRGYGSARISRKLVDTLVHQLDDPNTKRSCKIRSGLAWNLFILYHCVLLFMEILLAVTCPLHHFCDDLMQKSLWILVGINYAVVVISLVKIARAYGAYRTNGRIGGHMHACTSFELLNFVIFWASFFLMTTCGVINCKNLPSDLGKFVSGFIAIPFVTSYIVLGVIAGSHAWRFGAYGRTISKQDAVELLKQEIEEPPTVEYTVSCGHEERGGECIGINYTPLVICELWSRFSCQIHFLSF